MTTMSSASNFTWPFRESWKVKALKSSFSLLLIASMRPSNSWTSFPWFRQIASSIAKSSILLQSRVRTTATWYLNWHVEAISWMSSKTDTIRGPMRLSLAIHSNSTGNESKIWGYYKARHLGGLTDITSLYLKNSSAKSLSHSNWWDWS